MKKTAKHLALAVLAGLALTLLLAACSPKPLEEKELVSKLRRSDAFLPGRPKVAEHEIVDRVTDKKAGTDTVTLTVTVEEGVEAELTYVLTFAEDDGEWELESVERAKDGPWQLEGPSRRDLAADAGRRDDYLSANSPDGAEVKTVSEEDGFDPEEGEYTKTLSLEIAAPSPEDGDTYTAAAEAVYTLTEDGWELDRWDNGESRFVPDEPPEDAVFLHAVNDYTGYGIDYTDVMILERGEDLENGTAWAQVQAVQEDGHLTVTDVYRFTASYRHPRIWNVDMPGAEVLSSRTEWDGSILPILYDAEGGYIYITGLGAAEVSFRANITTDYRGTRYGAGTDGTVTAELTRSGDGFDFTAEGVDGFFRLYPSDMRIIWYFDPEYEYEYVVLYGVLNVPEPQEPAADLTSMYAPGTELRMAVGYNTYKTGISFDDDTARDGLTLLNGRTYYPGNLKPVWAELQDRLSVRFTDVFTGAGPAASEFAYWSGRLSEVDVLIGTASNFNKAGAEGKLVDLADYLDVMPNFKAFLEADPVVWASITANNEGDIYYVPYADSICDLTRVPLMRADWVKTLLNGEGMFTGTGKPVVAGFYTPYMPTAGKVTVDVVKADGSGVEQIEKDYDTYGNIIQRMNEAGPIDGVQAVNMLRDYIDITYNGYYGTNRADLFIGQNAAWDADELVALLRCVVANPMTLNGTDSVQGLFVRETDNNQRRVDLVRLAGQLFGVRGLESTADYLYLGADGVLRDARTEADAYAAMERMHAMVQERLISVEYVTGDAFYTADYLEGDYGFMEFDYSQPQTAFNGRPQVLQSGESFRAVMVPVARWNDGTGERFMRFAEGWRSAHIDGMAVSAPGVNGNEDKLYAALSLLDYMYSREGIILLSYGPDEFIKRNTDGSAATFRFNGEEWPLLADGVYEEMQERTSSFTSYMRSYLGAALVGVRAPSVEYLYTTPEGQVGAGILSNAVALGVIRHPELTFTENPWYTSVPTGLFQKPNETEKAMLDSYTSLNDSFSQLKFQQNLFVDIIVNGLSFFAGSPQDAAANVAVGYNGNNYLALYDRIYQELRAASFLA